MKRFDSVKRFSRGRLVALPLVGGAPRLVLGDHPQIVSDHAPANPAFHAIRSVITAACQSMPALERADPPFDARPPVAALAEPALPLVRQTRRALPTRSGQDHLPDPA